MSSEETGSEPAIRVENLGKRYRVKRLRRRHNTLRDALDERIRSLIPSLRASLRRAGREDDRDSIWALSGVTFEVPQGQVLGIIGANGAGKSTLLKVLSRITEPTTGRAEIRGRVGSLLEVGTGFHSELTGRENIYLNGAILGMTRSEIDARFDAIVDFSEVERFLDTPVKRYSSGMYLRLAFAVAAHLEPEVLLVDEVLAVGDAAFQKKCLGKMNEIAGRGRTVLFVSHNMLAVEELCDAVIWIQDGGITMSGRPRDVVAEYLKAAVSHTTERVWDDPATAPGNSRIRLHRVRVLPKDGHPTHPIDVRTPFVLEFEYWSLEPGDTPVLEVNLLNEKNILLFSVRRAGGQAREGQASPGLYRDSCHVPGDILNNGWYRIGLRVYEELQPMFRYDDILSFQVWDAPETKGDGLGEWRGIVRPAIDWHTERIG